MEKFYLSDKDTYIFLLSLTFLDPRFKKIQEFAKNYVNDIITIKKTLIKIFNKI